MVVSVTPQRAFELISRGEVDVVDVRNAEEWASGVVPSARLVPLSELRASPEKSLPRDCVLFVCAGGVRSQTAGSIALAHGLHTVYSVIGGMDSWGRAGLPVEHEQVAV